jgi:cell volume regulation protein A
MVGNQRVRAREHVIRVMDGLAWLAQAGMFLILGLLVTPSHLLDHLWPALSIAAFLMLAARPIAVWLSLLPFHFPYREIHYISWVGLRGAVPVVLSIFPVMAGLPYSQLLFDVTFMVVLVSLLVQGMTVAPAARWLQVLLPYRAKPLDMHDLWISGDEVLQLVSFKVEPQSPAVGHVPTTLTRDPSWHCVLIVRDGKQLIPDQNTTLKVGDEAWILVFDEEMDRLAEAFSREEQQGSLAVRNFFGEFVLNAHSPALALAAVYGVRLTPQEEQGTIEDVIAKRLARSLVIGDGVVLDRVRLTVRSMEGGKVLTVGLKLIPKPANP